MICPKCHAEYREGTYKCADCDVWLVTYLPDKPADADSEPKPELDESEEGELEYQELVTILTTNNLSILLIARSVLDSAGIDYYTQGDALGGIVDSRLLVRESDVEEAVKLLETLPEEGEMGGSEGEAHE
ncbi:MAG: DUF2007 domain-containing protein [Candidatus Zixiibacteriota bacterium]